MESSIIFNQVLILFIILAIGYVAGKFKILDSSGTKKLSEVLLFVAAPMMVLGAFFIEFSKERLVNIIWIVGFATFMFIVSIMLSKLIYRRFHEMTAPVLRFAAVFSNCGYMGLPLMKAIFGDEGAFYGSFYIVVFHVFLWSYGYVIFGSKDRQSGILKRVLLNPSIIALYIGTIIFIFSIPVPLPIKGAVKAVGDMTLPLSMLIIGGVISTSRIVTLFTDWKVYLASFVRLILMPSLAFFIALIVGVPSLPAAITVTALAMPVAANATIFSEMFGKDAVFGSKCIAVSNLLSILTAPLIIGWVVAYM